MPKGENFALICMTIIFLNIMQAVEDQYPMRNHRGELVYRIHQPQYFKMNNPYIELQYSTDGIGGQCHNTAVTITVSRGQK